MKTHASQCDCLECVKHDTFQRHFSKHAYMYPEDMAERVIYFSKFLNAGPMRAVNPIQMYSKPGGGSTMRKIEPGQVIGHLTESKNVNGVIWIHSSYGGWFKHDASGYDKANLKEVPLTDDQKLVAIGATVNAVNPLVKTAGNVVGTAASVAQKTATGLEDSVTFIGDTLGFITGNLKWVLIILAIAIIGMVLMRLRS